VDALGVKVTDYINMNETKVKAMKDIVEIDIKEEDVDAIISLGIRLALLQGIFDCTYEEVFETLEDKYGHRKVSVDTP